LRYLLLSVHYRAKLEWSKEIIDKSTNELTKLHEFLEEEKLQKNSGISNDETDNSQEIKKIQELKNNIIHELCQDFNSAAAIAQFFVFMKAVKASWGKSFTNLAWWREVDSVIKLVSDSLGIFHKDPSAFLKRLQTLKTSEKSIDLKHVENLIQQRLDARKAKDFKKSDAIRDELLKLGVKINDNPDGTTSWEL